MSRARVFKGEWIVTLAHLGDRWDELVTASTASEATGLAVARAGVLGMPGVHVVKTERVAA